MSVLSPILCFHFHDSDAVTHIFVVGFVPNVIDCSCISLIVVTTYHLVSLVCYLLWISSIVSGYCFAF